MPTRLPSLSLRGPAAVPPEPDVVDSSYVSANASSTLRAFHAVSPRPRPLLNVEPIPASITTTHYMKSYRSASLVSPEVAPTSLIRSPCSHSRTQCPTTNHYTFSPHSLAKPVPHEVLERLRRAAVERRPAARLQEQEVRELAKHPEGGLVHDRDDGDAGSLELLQTAHETTITLMHPNQKSVRPAAAGVDITRVPRRCSLVSSGRR